MIKKQFGIIGGDERNINLATYLREDNYVTEIYGGEDLQEFIHKSDVIIGPIPFTRDNITLNAPLINTSIQIKEFLESLNSEKTLFAGFVNDRILENCKAKIYNILADEEFAILNAIPTAEGAIEIAIRETNFTIKDSNVLVLGFGRIGKLLCKYFSSLGANVFCEARNQTDLCWIKTLGYNPVKLEYLDMYSLNMDIILNTVPSKMLNVEQIANLKKNCLYIELASNPGGVDKEELERYNIKYVNAQGLPGKVAPVTSSEYIKKVIYSNLN